MVGAREVNAAMTALREELSSLIDENVLVFNLEVTFRTEVLSKNRPHILIDVHSGQNVVRAYLNSKETQYKVTKERPSPRAEKTPRGYFFYVQVLS